MNMTPEEAAAIRERAAEILADRLYSELVEAYGGLAQVQLIALPMAAAILGVSQQHARRILPVVDTGKRPGGVTWADLKDTIERRRRPGALTPMPVK